MTTGWRDGIRDRVDQLGRYVEGRFVVEPQPDAELVPAEQFADDAYLRNVVVGAARAKAAEAGRDGKASLELHARVSRFVRQYTGSLSIAAMVGLAEGVGLNLAPQYCTLIMWEGLPYRITMDLPESAVRRSPERPTAMSSQVPALSSLNELRNHVLQSLYADNFAPMFAKLTEITGISQALLWTNAAEWVALISDSARQYLSDESAEPFLADRQAILFANQLPGLGGTNPLREKIRWTPLNRDTFPYEVATRRPCCLTYKLDERSGRLCASCPRVPMQDKIALINERHGEPAGLATGR